jgi:hypothetical protein
LGRPYAFILCNSFTSRSYLSLLLFLSFLTLGSLTRPHRAHAPGGVLAAADQRLHAQIPVMQAQAPMLIQLGESSLQQRIVEFGWLMPFTVPAHDLGQHLRIDILEHTTDRAIQRPAPQRDEAPDHTVVGLPQQTRQLERLPMARHTLIDLHVTHAAHSLSKACVTLRAPSDSPTAEGE